VLPVRGRKKEAIVSKDRYIFDMRGGSMYERAH
jgi:hypothetical protein